MLTSLLKWLTYKEALVHGLIPWDNGTPLEYPPTILASDGWLPHSVIGETYTEGDNKYQITRLSGLRTKKYCFMPVLCHLLVTHSMVN